MRFKQQEKAEERRQLKEAIRRLQEMEPKKYTELLRRARDIEYDHRMQREADERRQADAEQEFRRLELERACRFNKPVIVGLPDIDMSNVHGMVAFRVWNYDSFGLCSTAVRHHHWHEVNFADRIPGCDNQSGFYCIKLTGLGILTSGVNYFGIGRQSVSGLVELLGKVVEHKDGILRAEVARLICLFVTSESIETSPGIVHSLCDLYPITPVFVLNPEQLADVVMREVLRQRYMEGWE